MFRFSNLNKQTDAVFRLGRTGWAEQPLDIMRRGYELVATAAAPIAKGKVNPTHLMRPNAAAPQSRRIRANVHASTPANASTDGRRNPNSDPPNNTILALRKQ